MFRALTVIGALALFPTVASAQQPCTSDARHVVNEIYRHVLERSADGTSDVYVQGLTRGTATVRQIVGAVAKLTEHTQRFGGGGSREAHERAVSILYRHILAREADPDGLRAHADGMAGNGVGAVVDSLVNSAEYQRSFGDYGVPGSPGLRYCGPGEGTVSAAPVNMRFRNMDRNRDGVITRTEWQGTRQEFIANDWNGDGVLSRDEVRPGAARPRAAVAPSEEPFSFTAGDFSEIDFNRDGRITSAEWLHDPDTFRRVDRNRDGVLSRSEFLAGDVVDDLFESLDVNRNGRVERTEWDGTRASFDRLDTNRNNLLSRAELGADGSVGTSGVAGADDDRFDALDDNGNGRIERNEWDGTRAAFDRLDTNRNNILSRAEVAAAGRTGSDTFASLDRNRDGRLSIDEWNWNRRSFDQQDANGDGLIVPREFTGAPVPTTGR